MDQLVKELENIFERANKRFLRKNSILFDTKVSERTMCGALMLALYEEIKNTKYSEYFVDVEYNRNVGGKLKTIKKTVRRQDEQIITINCDLIIHSRGQNIERDNLIALEMKKSTAKKINKDKDRIRLQCLTRDPEENEVWSADGRIFPEHVCGYGLGIYYEIDFKQNSISLEYYRNGNCYRVYKISIR